MGYKVGPRLRESRLLAMGHEFTQPWAHLIAHLCTSQSCESVGGERENVLTPEERSFLRRMRVECIGAFLRSRATVIFPP